MNDWSGWELGRGIVLVSAIAYAGVWAQLTLYHWGGAFRRWEMLPPVFVTPLIVVLILLGVADRNIFGWPASAALVVGIGEGSIGFFFHSQAVVMQPGGLSLRNLIAGPPPVLPVAYSLVGVFGLVGLVWNA